MLKGLTAVSCSVGSPCPQKASGSRKGMGGSCMTCWCTRYAAPIAATATATRSHPIWRGQVLVGEGAIVEGQKRLSD